MLPLQEGVELLVKKTDKPEIGLEKKKTAQRSQGRCMWGENGRKSWKLEGMQRRKQDHLKSPGGVGCCDLCSQHGFILSEKEDQKWEEG